MKTSAAEILAHRTEKASNVLSIDMCKRFDRSGPAFELNVSAEIGPGITIVFGPSGAGKTTLLECIAGLLTPNAGKINIGPRPFFEQRLKLNLDACKRGVGYVFQDLALFPHLSVEKNIAYGIRNLDAALRETKVSRIADSFRIAHLRERKPHEVSGGERQRIALARALVTDPVVLLLDEPLNALDTAAKSRITDDIRAWNESHRIPVLYVTHSCEEVFALGDRAIVLEAGKIIADGPPKEVASSLSQVASKSAL